MITIFYQDELRGKILNPERKLQIIDYRGLKCKHMTPTDLDGFMEIRDDVYLFYEFKYKDAQLPEGQKRGLMKLVDIVKEAGRNSLLIIGRHDVDDPNEEIDAANTLAAEYYYDGSWRKSDKTVRQLTNDFLAYINKPFVFA